MPLIGVINPSHDERKANVAGRRPKWIPLDDLLTHAATKDPKWSPWTYELIQAVLNEHQERDYISTSLLTSACPRSAVIQRSEDYIMSLDSVYKALRGSLIHRTLEKSAREGSMAEWRFWTTIELDADVSVEVSCSPDLVTQDGIWDYKTTESPPAHQYPYRDHTLQVMFNRYVVNHAEKWQGPNGEKDVPMNPREIQFKFAVVVYLGPKWPKPLVYEKKQPWRFKSGKEGMRNQPYVFPDDEVEREMFPRIEAMHRALKSYPEWPDGIEEVWGGKPGWACPGIPECYLPYCEAKRWPDGLVWSNE